MTPFKLSEKSRRVDNHIFAGPLALLLEFGLLGEFPTRRHLCRHKPVPAHLNFRTSSSWVRNEVSRPSRWSSPAFRGRTRAGLAPRPAGGRGVELPAAAIETVFAVAGGRRVVRERAGVAQDVETGGRCCGWRPSECSGGTGSSSALGATRTGRVLATSGLGARGLEPGTGDATGCGAGAGSARAGRG